MALEDRKVTSGNLQPVIIAQPASAPALRVIITGGAGSGGTSMTDDTAFTPDTSGITPAAGFYDSGRDAVDDGDAGAFAMTSKRAIYTSIETPTGDDAMDDVNDAVRVNVVAGAAGGVSHVDDSGFAPGVDNIVPIGGFADDTAPDPVNEGDAGAVRMSLRRELYVQIRDAAGNERGVNIDANNDMGVSQDTHDNFNANVNLQVGNVDVANGNPIPVSDAATTLSIDDGGATISIDDGGGDISIDDGGNSITVDGTLDVLGDVADDAVDSGDPVKIGGVAKETDGTDPGSVSAEGDRAELATDRNRRLLVNTAHPNLWNTNDNYAAAQTNALIKAAPGANLSLYITRVILSTDTTMNIKIVDDPAGAPADILGPFYFAAYGGAVLGFNPPIRVDPNTAIGVTSSDNGNHTVVIDGYTAP